MEEIVQLVTKTYGVAGLIMLSPLVAVVFLWRQNLAQTIELARVNEQRIADAKAVSEKLLLMVKEQSTLNQQTNSALERVGDVITMLSTHQLRT